LELRSFCRDEYPRLTRFLDVYCGGDLAVAEELAQETLARVWKNWRKVSHFQNPSAWAHRVAVNLANSHLRRRAAERRARDRASREAAPRSNDRSDAIALREAVASLPTRMRAVLMLRYYLDLSYPQIADLLQVPESTARSLVHRALKRLRQEPAVQSFKEAFDV
jgi:RNA polymerase sigma factor (sigma-70 family)